MIKIENKKTAIVGGVVGLVILLTIFCCNGKQEAVEEVAPAEAIIEEVVAPVEEAIEEIKESVEEVIEKIEEVIPSVEEVTPAESAE